MAEEIRHRSIRHRALPLIQPVQFMGRTMKQFDIAFYKGYCDAIDQYSIWKGGKQYVGALMLEASEIKADMRKTLKLSEEDVQQEV